MTPKTIKDYIYPGNGFVVHMNFDFEIVTKEQLDLLFYANYGNKNPAPIVTNILSEMPTVTELETLANFTLAMYRTKWQKYLNLTKVTYDPIHNYRDELTETINEVGANDVQEELSASNNRTNNINRDNTRTDNLSSTTQKTATSSLNADTDDSIYGFNSADSSDSDVSKTVETSDLTSDGTVANTGTQKVVAIDEEIIVDTKSNTNQRNTTNTNERTRTSVHEGNIGNLTTQQLMRQEIELWKWNFTQTVLADINEFLTIPIYLS